MAREPGYCKHKSTGQAYVNLGGKVIYLGTHGTEESKERYNRLKAEWLVNRHTEKFQPKATAGPFVSDVCNAFLDHAEDYYPNSSELKLFKLAIQPLSELYAKLPALNFGTKEFKVCRNWWLSNPKRSRVYVNKQMKRLVHLYFPDDGRDKPEPVIPFLPHTNQQPPGRNYQSHTENLCREEVNDIEPDGLAGEPANSSKPRVLSS